MTADYIVLVAIAFGACIAFLIFVVAMALEIRAESRRTADEYRHLNQMIQVAAEAFVRLGADAARLRTDIQRGSEGHKERNQSEPVAPTVPDLQFECRQLHEALLELCKALDEENQGLLLEEPEPGRRNSRLFLGANAYLPTKVTFEFDSLGRVPYSSLEHRATSDRVVLPFAMKDARGSVYVFKQETNQISVSRHVPRATRIYHAPALVSQNAEDLGDSGLQNIRTAYEMSSSRGQGKSHYLLAESPHSIH